MLRYLISRKVSAVKAVVQRRGFSEKTIKAASDTVKKQNTQEEMQIIKKSSKFYYFKQIVRFSMIGGIFYVLYDSADSIFPRQFAPPRVARQYPVKNDLDRIKIEQIQKLVTEKALSQYSIRKQNQLKVRENIDEIIDKIMLRDIIKVNHQNHPLQRIPPDFNVEERKLQINSLNQDFQLNKGALQRTTNKISKDMEESTSDYDSHVQSLENDLKKIETLRGSQFGSDLQNLLKTWPKYLPDYQNLFKMNDIMEKVSLQEIDKLQSKQKQFSTTYDAIFSALANIANLDVRVQKHNDIKKDINVFISSMLSQQNNFNRKVDNAKYLYQVETICKKGEEIKTRSKQNEQRLYIEKSAHQHEYEKLKDKCDRDDLVTKIRILVSLMENCVIEGRSFSDVLLFFRAISKRDEFLHNLYESVVMQDPRIIKGIQNIEKLRRQANIVTTRTIIGNYFYILQPNIIQMGLISMWYRYLRPNFLRYDSQISQGPVQMMSKCNKVDRLQKLVFQLDSMCQYLSRNQIEPALELISQTNNSGIADEEEIKNFRGKLERRVRVDKLRKMLLQYAVFLQTNE